MAINSAEDRVYVITNSGQLIEGPLNCNDPEGPPFTANFSYVQSEFHRGDITGLDVCIRKQIVATCSKDKKVNIWDYATRTLELQQTFTEECHAVALHPSGLHLAVALPDKIQMCNILSDKLEPYKTL
jgi:WD40 repeat protein